MLQYDIAKKLYDDMKAKASKEPEDFYEFFEDFLKSATDYASIRTNWSFMDREIRMEQDRGPSMTDICRC